jgi:hypothetical protein
MSAEPGDEDLLPLGYKRVENALTRGGAGDITPPLSPLLSIPSPTMSGDQALRIPKNKSTGNLAQPTRRDVSPLSQRTRFSFDAGTSQEISNLKRWV